LLPEVNSVSESQINERSDTASPCLWLIIPLGPTGYGESPCFSVFAGNTNLIGPEGLVRGGPKDRLGKDSCVEIRDGEKSY
jgi:hypothetical protein